jgi:membrane protease YdiL (CAAX protease family)
MNEAPKGFQKIIQKNPLLSYFFISYAFSWITLIPYILGTWGVLEGDFSSVFALHTFGPAVAAYSVTRLTEGKTGLQELWSKVKSVKVGLRWYLFVLVGIPVLYLLGVVVQPGKLESFQGFYRGFIIFYLINFIIVFLLGGPLGEEIGWRGFALPRMQPRYGPLKGSLMLGVLWAFWHLADFLTPYHGSFLSSFPVYFLLVVSLSVIFTWLFNNTKGSVFMAILAHTSVNTPELTLVPLFSQLDVNSMHLAILIGFGLPALLIIALTHGKLDYSAEKKRQIEASTQKPV